jgi:hypothetical protein
MSSLLGLRASREGEWIAASSVICLKLPASVQASALWLLAAANKSLTNQHVPGRRFALQKILHCNGFIFLRRVNVTHAQAQCRHISAACAVKKAAAEHEANFAVLKTKSNFAEYKVGESYDETNR